MAENTGDSEIEMNLQRFEARNRPSGRLVCFAHGRLMAFPLRLALTFFGTAVIATLEEPRLALVLALISLLGEMLDALALLPRQAGAGGPV